uniref:Gastrin/cholecystokinin type B receptor n=1 Tax=Gadus morhua TaxID=8049 RepID=A0A8C5FK80_GADMO
MPPLPLLLLSLPPVPSPFSPPSLPPSRSLSLSSSSPLLLPSLPLPLPVPLLVFPSSSCPSLSLSLCLCRYPPPPFSSPPLPPGEDHTLRILLYSLIFLLSVLGNLLIIVVLAVNNDLMMALFCMPFNLIPSLLKDFIFGAAMCKIVAYLMGTSVSISTFSLVAIAIERYSAICNPLKSRVWQTRSHAYRVIAATWLLAFVVMTPYPIISHLDTFRTPGNTTGHQCRHKWPHATAEQAWCVLLLLMLFVVPGLVMIVAYGLISRELYRGIQLEMGQKRESTGERGGLVYGDGDGCYVNAAPATTPAAAPLEMSTLTPRGPVAPPPRGPPERLRSNASGAQLRAKKRVIRMLLVVVALFFVCWTPLYAANAWRAFAPAAAGRALSGAPISFIQLLCSASACVNPVIYCFMNTRFRKALLATCSCCAAACRHRRRRRQRGRHDNGLRDNEEEATMATGASMASKFSYTTVSTMGTC